MKMKCLIVDDEPFARKGIAEYVSGIDFLSLAGQCGNALDANKILGEEKIDLLFLDINMPGLSGLELLRSLKTPPMAILITAYPEHALDGFHLDVIDYLLKPVAFDRFLRACNKARDYFSAKQTQPVLPAKENFFFVKADNRIEKIAFDKILFAKALQNYVEIHLSDRRIITYLSFKNLEAFLPAEQFLKVHKSYIVPIAKVKSIEGNELCIENFRIPIGRQQKAETLELILGGRYLKR